MGQFPTPPEPWLQTSGRLMVSQKRLLRYEHNIPDVPKMIEGPETRASCHLATESLTNTVYGVHHVQA